MYLSSLVPSQGYPPNAVGANQCTKNIAEAYYDSQRPEIAKAVEERNNPTTPSYKWPLIGLAVSAIAAIVVRKMPRP